MCQTQLTAATLIVPGCSPPLHKRRIWRFFQGADILGYSCLRFDVPMPAAEFERLGSSGADGGSGNAPMAFPPAGTRVVDAYVRWQCMLATAHEPHRPFVSALLLHPVCRILQLSCLLLQH